MSTVSAVILTYNEEVNLPACLDSLRGLAAEVFVIDSGSTDQTVDIAGAAGAHVISHPFTNQAEQLNWALDHVQVKSEWVLRLDADERLTEDLVRELCSGLSPSSPDVTGYYMKRRVHFMGRWMRHGGYYPAWFLRIWRAGCAKAEQRAVDEHMVLLRGRPGYLKHDFVDDNRKGLTAWIEKENGYSTREVTAMLNRLRAEEVAPALFGKPEARRRWLKYNVYLRSPAFMRAYLYFLWRYVFRLGFLDGKEGLIFHFLQGCWYRFLIDAKLYEARLSERRG